MIAAILRAQMLSMRFGNSRGAVLSLITGVIWYSFWCFVASAVFTFARIATILQLEAALPAALLLVFIYWQVVPVISGTMGSALDMSKLIVYPASHDRLFVVEMMLRLTTAAEMLLVILGGAAGLMTNIAIGRTRAPLIVVPLLLYLLFNVLLASGLRSLLERLLSRRRIREVLVILLFAAITLPRYLLITRRPSASALDRFVPAIQLAAAPWAAAAHFMLGEQALWALGILLLWLLAAAWFGRTQFERNLHYDALAAQATPLDRAPSEIRSWPERLVRWPALLFRDPLAVLVEKELRSLARTPRFRVVFITGFSFGLLVWLPFVWGRQADRSETITQNFLAVVCVYALTLLGQVTFWNCFGFDRSAVVIYFAAPQPLTATLIAKNIAALVFIYVQVGLLTGLTWLLHVGPGWNKIVETLVVVGVCCLYSLAFGNLSSVHFPRSLRPERVSQGGASSRFQALVFLLYPLTLLPVFLAYLARYALDSQTAFVVTLALAAGLGALLYRMGLDSAVEAAGKRRENMIEQLSRGEGPVESN